jgi:Fic family protein
MNYPTQFSYLSVFWVAAAAFVVALCFDIYVRTRSHRNERLGKAQASRMHKALAHLRADRPTKLTNDLWQELTGVSDTTAARDLTKLVEMGVLTTSGRGRATHYRFVKKAQK